MAVEDLGRFLLLHTWYMHPYTHAIIHHTGRDERRVSSRLDPEKEGQPLNPVVGPPARAPAMSAGLKAPLREIEETEEQTKVLDRQLTCFGNAVRIETGVMGPILASASQGFREQLPSRVRANPT